MIFLLALCLASLIPGAAAQSATSGDVSGTVTDPTGAVVPNANVKVKSSETGASQSTVSNAQGFYRISFLKPGPYVVSVEAPGFKGTSYATRIAIGQVSTVNVTMVLGQESTTVEVSGEAPVIQTENADNSTSFSERQISLVPNPGNDLSYVAQAAPGSIMNTQAGYGNFSANGLPGTSNLFTVNGQNENDPFLNLNNSGATNLLLGNNDVREATVTTNGYSGQYGTLAGANVAYVTKSGSNSFHGNALYWWNGSRMNANSYFNNQSGTPKPFVNANQWGASFGGPIWKDKTFFFVDTEGLRFLLPTSTNAKIPSPEFQQATLANLAVTSPGSVPFYNQLFSLWNNAPGASLAQPVAGSCDNFTAAPLANCAMSFTSTVGQLSTEWLLTARIDQNIGNNDRLFGHFRSDHGFQATLSDVISPLFNVGSTQPQYEGQLQETHSFGSTSVNQFIMSGQWYSALFDVKDETAALQALPFRLSILGGTFSSLGRFFSIVPQGRNVTQYQLLDDFSTAKGNHSLKFGVSFRRNDVSDYDPGIGSIGASNNATLDDFFNGNGGTYFQSFPSKSRQPIGIYALGFYAQDEWRLRPSFKLNLSIRGDHFSNPVCQTNCFSRLAGDFLGVSHDPNQPYNQAIQSGLHELLPKYTAIEWQPRIGFAWNPFGLKNTVIRAGFGLFADSFPANLADQLLTNPPLQVGFNIDPAPLSPDVTGNQAALAAGSNAAFQSGFANGATFNDLSAVPGFSAPTFNTVTNNIHNPRYQEWNLQLEQALGARTSFSVNYVGNHGIHEVVQNPGLNAFCDSTCLSDLGSTASQFGDLPTAMLDQRFNTVTETSSTGVSNYNGVTFSLTHRTNILQVQGNYRYSHALDTVSNGGILQFNNNTNVSILAPIDPFNLKRLNYGNADYDIRHYFSLNYVLNVPHHFGPDALLGGWVVSGSFFARSGIPFTVVDGAAYGELNGFNYGISATSTIPAQIIGNSSHNCDASAAAANGAHPCLLASNFDLATSDFGNQRRNQFFGPNFFNTDLTVMKNFKIPHWEGAQFGVGAQFFNILNHPHFDQPDADITSPSFGSIINPVSTPTSIFGSFLGADASPRLIQLHAKLTF